MPACSLMIFAPLGLLVTTATSLVTSMIPQSRTVERVVHATNNGPITRLIGTVDIDGGGTNHPLAEASPCILLDRGTIPKNDLPPFGEHPHRGHSVVTILMQGKVKSWDSFSQKESVISAPASYWVDAGRGLFHDERSLIEDEDDPSQHMSLFQLWVGVKEEDRQKAPRVQIDEQLPMLECRDSRNEANVIGKGVYYVGEPTSIETPHPITIAIISLNAGEAAYRFPVDPAHAGFVVHMRGTGVCYGGTSPQEENDVLVLHHNSGDSERPFLEVVTTGDSNGVEFLICVGERIEEPWCKKLAASGAIIAKTPAEARSIAANVIEMSKAGKEGGSFAPFGL